MDKDLRYQILIGLSKMGHSTEDIPVNGFLASLRTYIDTEDLGTIKRALDELISEGLIMESSNHKGRIETIITKGPKESAKNPKRFLEKIGDFEKIPDIYLVITLKGKKFLIEWQKLNTDFSNSRYLKNTRWIPLVVAILGVLIGLYNIFQRQFDLSSKEAKDKTEIIKP